MGTVGMDGFVYIPCCYKLPACPGTAMRSISHLLHALQGSTLVPASCW